VKFTPFPYQQLIAEHEIAALRGGVWAGMGMGKTAATLLAIDAHQMTDSRPVLVLAPKRVAQSTWPDEVKKWSSFSHMEAQPILGTPAQREAALKNSNANIFTINYENVPWLVDQLGERWPFAGIVADESTRLKSFRLGGPNGQRARSIGKIAHKHIERWWNLTGTPSPNGLVDLWGQTWFLDRGQALGLTFGAFEQRFFRKIPVGGPGYRVEPMPHAREQIEDLVRQLHITVDPADWFDLREPIMVNRFIELPSSARGLYRDMEREMFMEIGGTEIEAFNAASKTIKCLQLANGAAYLGDGDRFREVHDAKIRELESITEEASGAAVLVAYHFKSDLARLMRAFPYARHLDDDPQTIRDWNEGRIRLLFAHPASAGHGLNLQDGGHHLVFFGHWWNLEEYQQIVERIGPMRQRQSGHDRPVFIYNIIAKDTVDEVVIARRESKRGVQDLLLEAMKRRDR
jgi:SNF2 family DNA or RNA helicase